MNGDEVVRKSSHGFQCLGRLNVVKNMYRADERNGTKYKNKADENCSVAVKGRAARHGQRGKDDKQWAQTRAAREWAEVLEWVGAGRSSEEGVPGRSVRGGGYQGGYQASAVSRL